MHDAITLANWMSTLRLAGVSELDKFFKEYRKERYPIAKESFRSSRAMGKNMGKVQLNTESLCIVHFRISVTKKNFSHIPISPLNAESHGCAYQSLHDACPGMALEAVFD